MKTKVLLAITSLCVGLVLSLILGEIYLRCTTSASFRLAHNEIILPKNQTYIYKNTGLRGCDPKIVHHKNSLGFRGAEPPKDFANTLTLIAVGGSTTECFYLSDGHSWPEIVGELLEPDIRHFWINNAGLDGHSTFGHQILVRDVLAPMHPKVVLLMVGINDVGRDDLVISDREFLKENRDTTALKRAMRSLEEHSRMAAWIENLFRSASAWKKGLSHHAYDIPKIPALTVTDAQMRAVVQEHETKYVKGYRQRLEALLKACRDAGIVPVLITQPALYGKGRDFVTGANLETIKVDDRMNGKLAWRVLELYNETTRSVGRANGVLVIDLARGLGKSSHYFYDFYHFTNAGAEAAGEVVAKHLKSFLTKKYPEHAERP